jgi:putative ABC transport system ATP-binding protein
MALVELEGVTVSVTSPSPATLLGPIDLTVDSGESVAVVGPSGAGKSTLVSVHRGMLPVSDGAYRFRGEALPMSQRHLARFRATGVGFVFQAAHLLDDRTALENVELALTVSDHRSTPVTAALGALTAAGVEHLAERPARVLSGGERQRVAVARALVREPALLIADEPTGSLDQVNGAKILDLLLELPRHGAALVLVTHDPAAAKRAQRMVRIVDGQLA